MLDNDTVEIHQIKDIKDDLEYYIENCRDPDFMENDMLYEDIDGLEEMLLNEENDSDYDYLFNIISFSIFNNMTQEETNFNPNFVILFFASVPEIKKVIKFSQH